MIIFYQMGLLNKWTIIISSLPSVIMIFLQMQKHPVRKEIPYIKYKVFWKYDFNKRNKEFVYRKGALIMTDKQDARRKIGIKSVFADCYETSDKRFVRVFEVSSVNLSLANKSEKRATLESFRVFMTTITFLKNIQFAQIAQPINLSKHLTSITKKQENETNAAKVLLNKGYTKHIEDIQKSRDLVTRKRFIIISQKIGNDRDKALDQIDQNSILLMSKVENMSFDYSSLSIKQLNNDELTKLMYTCVDYDNSVSYGQYIVNRANNRSDVSFGEQSLRQLVEKLSKDLETKIN